LQLPDTGANQAASDAYRKVRLGTNLLSVSSRLRGPMGSDVQE